MTNNISISSFDADALARIAHAEANDVFNYYHNIGFSDADAAKMSYGMVIDIIINRVAAGSSTIYGSSIQAVIDKPGQFEAVSIAGGSWVDLPAADTATTTLVEEYLAARANGAPSIVGAATDYLNPTVATSAWDGTGPGQGWGQTMKNTSYFGAVPLNEDGTPKVNVISHVVGNANNLRPDPYTVSYDGNDSPVFSIPHDILIPLKDMPQGFTHDPAFALAEPIIADMQPQFAGAVSASSPLVLDLSTAHSGVTLTEWNAATTGTFFDLNENGFAVQTAWVTGDTGLLARDLNANGRIDSTAELFGSPTVDGFAKLAVLDSNHDMRIDANDEAWSTLVVWTDTNGDAVTQEGELHSLASLGIANIDLAGVAASTSTISGNPISHTSTVTFTDGATATVADAWFVHDNTNSYYTGSYTLDPEVLFLPTLRGYGTLPDLSIAMSQDSDLKDMVADFVGDFTLADIATSDAAITGILYKWAGVDNVDPGSRGAYIDARHLAFLEHFLGSDFIQEQTHGPNPLANAAAELEEVYQTAFKMLSADILIQAGGATLFDGSPTYDPYSGEITGNAALSEDGVGVLASAAPAAADPVAVLAYWEHVARFIDRVMGVENVTSTEESWLDDAIHLNGSTYDWSSIAAARDSGPPVVNVNGDGGDNTIFGTDGNDEIIGFGGNDLIYGGAGNDILRGDNAGGPYGNDELHGGDGNDTLIGLAGNDVLDGGLGGNILRGYSGDDTYIFSGGDDLIDEQSAGGNDLIVMADGITLSDLSFGRVDYGASGSYSDLMIWVSGGGSIQIHNQLATSTSSYIESIQFSDSTTLDLSTITDPNVYLSNNGAYFSSSTASDLTIHGGAGADTIAVPGSHANVTLIGGAGNDDLRGGYGNDTYIAGPGLDSILEHGGTDTIVMPEGFTADDVEIFRLSSNTYSLMINIAGLGEIEIKDQFYSTDDAIENLHFLSDNSTVNLVGMSVTTIGTAGNDSLSSPLRNASANDVMDGREGDDTLTGGTGDDTYVFSAGHDKVSDTDGNDTILIRSGYNPEDIAVAWNTDPVNANNNRGMILTDIDGNTLIVKDQSYTASHSVEHIAFAGGTIWNLNEMELELHGTEGNDSLTGRDIGDASSDDTIFGYGGNDTINGGDGNDLIFGGDGNDTLRGQAGDDTIFGGDGDDYIYTSSNDGNDIVHGDGGDDTISGVGYSVLNGDAGDDTLRNSASSANAASTAVKLFGGDGDDDLFGGYGHTTLNGGAGADTLTGSSSGVDTFTFDAATAFDAVDTVKTFNKNGSSHDVMDISDILDGHYDPVSDAITDFVQFSTNGSNTEVYVDPTGAADFGAAAHIATIQSVTGLEDEAALVSSGLLLAA